MNQAQKLYDFAASAGALEGYVYHKTHVTDIDMDAMGVWTNNLVQAYERLPQTTRKQIQPGLDRTLNRAVSSLGRLIAADHPVMVRLKSMAGEITACSPDDFQKKKWFQNGRADR